MGQEREVEMASFGHKLMVYLGLSDDEYQDYDDYDDYAEPDPQTRTPLQRVTSEPPETSLSSSIRPLSREERSGSGSLVTPRPAVVRTITPEKPVVHVVAPCRFADAQEIGDCLRGSQPVIVNLQMADRDLSRRMIDFCSGVTYALGGHMDKVAEQVFLLSPSNVSVSAEERQRLSERGFTRG
jgi:cell division inhibitor SepF